VLLLSRDRQIPSQPLDMAIRREQDSTNRTRWSNNTLQEDYLDPRTGETVIVFRKIGKHDIYRNP